MRGKLKNTISLKDKNPSYLSMFDVAKNSINPIDIPLMSTMEFWWRCENQHAFKKTAASMNVNPSCHECSYLVFSHPELAREFHPKKNIGNDIREIAKSSSLRVWWVCKNGHEWQRPIGERVREKSGCPECYNQNRSKIIRKSAVERVGSLQSKMPELLTIWDYERNDILPSEVTSKSNVKIWWKCLNGHPSYKQAIVSKSSSRNCPICTNELRAEKVRLSRLKKDGSFKENHPELMKYWDESKNEILDPNMLTSGSKVTVNWVCPNNHEWHSSLNTMTEKRRTHICPKCKNKKQ